MRSIDDNPEDPDGAFAALFELFSKAAKSPQKYFCTYQLTFKDGEPIFTLTEASRIMEEAFVGIFDPGTIE